MRISSLSLLCLACAVAIIAATSAPNVEVIKNYWLCQPNASGRNCSLFFDHLADDVIFGSSIMGVTTVGKAAVVATISSIGTPAAGYYIDSIDAIIVDQNADGSIVFAQVNKTLCGVLTGKCARKLNYAMIAHFDSLGYARKLLEIVPAQFLREILPLGLYDANNHHNLADMCYTLNAVCADTPVDYGTSAGGTALTCFKHWQGAPLYNKNYVLMDRGFSTGCVALTLGKLALGLPSSALCPKFGVAQPNITGCWN